MRILLTNHELKSFAGTEIFTYTIASSLKKRGHHIEVYSAYLGDFSRLFFEHGIPVVDELKHLSGNFDIAHVHHNINAFEIRNHYPNLPMVFVSHGVLPKIEQPPLVELGICKYIAISEEVQKNIIRFGIDPNRVKIIRNPIDETKFFPTSKISSKPKNALVISNKIDFETENIIREACARLDINIKFVGKRFQYVPNEDLPKVINQNDIIFNLGRGVVEGIMCGRVPIIIDAGVGDGLVTPENFRSLMSYHFSGRVYKHNFTSEELVHEILKYKPEFGEQLRVLALEEFSVERQTDKLIEIYHQCISSEKPEFSDPDKNLIDQFCQAINITRIRSKGLPKDASKTALIQELGGDRAYRFFRSIGRLRWKLIPSKSKLEKLFVKKLR